MKSLPFEVVEDILCRLPVKPLKRFRCVAKSWHSLIDSERFVKCHLKRSLETNSHRRLIVVGDTDQVFKVDLDNDDLVNTKASVIKLPDSIRAGDIANTCNGLFLVSTLNREPISIWNPFTAECKKLPRIGDEDFPLPFGCSSKIVYGLAWDSRNDDYKVVRVVEHWAMSYDACIESRAHIYGLKSNSWRQTENFTYPVRNWHTDVNGALHTLIFDFASDTVKIMGFSVESEKHYEVKLPPLKTMWERDVVGMSLLKLGGCLSMNHINESGIEIWVMKDYGVSASWTQMFSIPSRLSELANYAMRPLVYTKDGNQVLVCFGYNTFLWLDLRNQTMETVYLEGLPYVINYVVACFENLVSVCSDQVHKQVNDQDKGKDKKKIEKKRDDSQKDEKYG